MPQKYLDLYDPDQMQTPDNFLPVHPFDNGELLVRDEKLAASPRTKEEMRRHLAEYSAMISHLDDRIGDVIAAVRRRGELENTVFVFCGDNGLALGQHGLMGKQSLYDHSVRVPLIFCGPGIPQGKTTSALAYLLDVFPTLCRLCGVPLPDSVEGMDLRPCIQGGAQGRESLYLAYSGKHRGIRTASHKLIEYVVGGKHVMTQLFDLDQDPGEMNNLAGSQDHQKLLQDMKSELFRARDSWEDEKSVFGKTFWSGFRK